MFSEPRMKFGLLIIKVIMNFLLQNPGFSSIEKTALDTYSVNKVGFAISDC